MLAEAWTPGTPAPALPTMLPRAPLPWEALRILKAIDFKPAVRFASLLLGSRAYVKQYFGAHTAPTDRKKLAVAEWLRKEDTPLILKPEQAKVSAYFNVDDARVKFAVCIYRRTKRSNLSSGRGCSPSPILP